VRRPRRYWAAIRTHAGLQGGFVWDWVDQALVQTLDDGTERLAYGGDFGDEPNDGAFVCDGLVAADRTPHPSLLELAKVIQPVQVRALDAAAGALEVTNEHAFIDLAWLQPSWVVHVDGDEVARSDLEPLATAPGATSSLSIPIPPLALTAGRRAHLTVSWRTRAALPWAPAGHEVAWDQFEIAAEAGASRAPGSIAASPRTVDELQPHVTVWRAPIDNETFGPGHAARWEQLGLGDDRAQFDASTVTSHNDDGTTVMHTVVIPGALDDIPRVGVRLRVGAGVHAVEWLGAGPHECYSDRRASARVGRWTTLVDDWPVPTSIRRRVGTASTSGGSASSPPTGAAAHDRRARRPAGNRLPLHRRRGCRRRPSRRSAPR
jgi:beta-galactosidase